MNDATLFIIIATALIALGMWAQKDLIGGKRK